MPNYRVQLLPLLFSACLVSGEVAAAECQAVAESTLAEISAGASAPLDAKTAALVRRAAGAACVKALSGRYPAAVAVEPDRVAENTAGAAAADAAAADAAAADAAAADAAKGDPESQAAADVEEKDSSFWPFDSFKRNDVSASPSKKPYQRKR